MSGVLRRGFRFVSHLTLVSCGDAWGSQGVDLKVSILGCDAVYSSTILMFC